MLLEEQQMKQVQNRTLQGSYTYHSSPPPPSLSLTAEQQNHQNYRAMSQCGILIGIRNN